jgi:hypothetical protein
VRATFTAFSSFVTFRNIYGIFVILIRHAVFNSASSTHAHIFLFRRACRLLAAHENFFGTNDEKYQTRLIFGLHVTNDENAVNVARTRRNFVDPTCHEYHVRATSALVCGGL